ncbi:MAG: carbohydrate ABC transporter permease [Actinomycetota bacterium]|nr:carbohydrate ABC transporter permease [Actinomycetota bacterium]MDA8301454.1 carbohydrate ABC transporter permease [Actinomycetota bacterium]
MRAGRHRGAGRVVTYMVLIVAALFAVFPIWWIVSTSLESPARAYSFPGALIPQGTGANYAAAWQQGPWGRFLLNSLGIGFATTTFVLATGISAAYAIVFLPSRWTRVAFPLVLATMMVPFYAILVPDYLIVRDLGWLNTYISQVVPFAASGFAIFLLVQFMRGFPRALRDAARMDGAGELRFLWSVVVPNLVPALVTVGVYTFLQSWNAFLWPLIVTTSSDVQPIQVGLANFLSTANGTNWTVLAAAAAITAAPMLLLYVLAQRKVVESVSRTGLKG